MTEPAKMEWTLAEVALEDGSIVRFDHLLFSTTLALAELPKEDAVAATKRIAEIVDEIIPAVKERSVPWKAAFGLRIDRWLAALGKDTGL